MIRNFYFSITFFLLLNSPGVGQSIDTVLVRQYSYTVYNGGLTNYSATQGQNNLLLFGNSSGLLTFDGSTWDLISIGQGQQVLSVLADGDKIYVGGINEFGYLAQDINGEWQYTSMADRLPEGFLVNEIWQILKTKQGIYFQSYQGILFFDGLNLKIIDVQNAYIYLFEDKIISSSFNGNINVIEGDKIVESLETPAIYGDAAYSILTGLEENSLLYLTSESGIWLLSTAPLRLKKWDSPLSRKLETIGFYHGIEYRDSLVVASTWKEGVIVFNKKGELIRKIDLKQGLPNGELRELYIDANENIWILANSGLYQMRFTLSPLVPDFNPITHVTSVESASGNSYNLRQPVTIYNPRSIIFSFTTPGLNKEDLEYSFYLEGYDDRWTPWSRQYTKEYSNLMNKNYTFKVKARPIGTTIESVPGQVSLTIRLPWYKRKVVIAFVAIVLLAMVFFILRMRSKQLKKSKADLEKMVNQRTHELSLEREKLQALNNELKLANNELDNFVYRSSHDLIAPLKSLLGLLNIIRLETSDQKVLTYVDMMEKSTLKLENFIRSIMEYSINAKSDIARESVLINELVNEIIEEIKYFDKTNDIDISVDLSISEVKSDSKRLKIILNNLITNAIKYHNPTVDNPWVKISSEDCGKEVKIAVKDNGIGIGEEHLSKVYQMFFRATENAEGSGLGLYIVKDTIDKLGGRVEITSEINHGTEVIIHLPKR